jgi:mono/diheme cytochrome c family protein
MNTHNLLRLLPSLFLCTILLSACAKSSVPDDQDQEPQSASLTDDELEHGIGPVSAFEPGPIDHDLVARGEEQFQIKCSACHKLDTRYVGPPLADVTQRRSPAYIMNMILNPEEMIQKHPDARTMLAQYATPMANQNVAEEDARAILEYLRSVAPSE